MPRSNHILAKGRTNTELREQFTLADGAAQSRATFTSRRHSAKTSNPGSDGGYSSASSSAGLSHFAYICLSSAGVPIFSRQVSSWASRHVFIETIEQAACFTLLLLHHFDACSNDSF